MCRLERIRVKCKASMSGHGKRLGELPAAELSSCYKPYGCRPGLLRSATGSIKSSCNGVVISWQEVTETHRYIGARQLMNMTYGLVRHTICRSNTEWIRNTIILFYVVSSPPSAARRPHPPPAPLACALPSSKLRRSITCWKRRARECIFFVCSAIALPPPGSAVRGL